MDAIRSALAAAWDRVGPRLRQDAAELRRRLARRKLKLFAHPPRAWCLAIRASDTRLGPYATSPADPRAGARHQVILDAAAVTHLCAPVRLTPPGQTIDETAHLLGTTRHS